LNSILNKKMSKYLKLQSKNCCNYYH
jgi:hypothetical protein